MQNVNLFYHGQPRFAEAGILLRDSFQRQEEQDTKESGRTFIVPSRLKNDENGSGLKVKKDEKQTVSIYVTPTDFLPDAVYDILVVAFVKWMRLKGRNEHAELFRNRSDFDLYDDHLVRLGAVKIKNMNVLKLEISHRIIEDSDGKSEISEPHRNVCIEVLDYFKHQLEYVYETYEGIGYKLSVLCTSCQPALQPHFHDLKDCLKKEKTCLSYLKEEFIEETKNFQIIQSLVVDYGTCKMKDFFLEIVQKRSSSVREFLKNEKESLAKLENFEGKDNMLSPDADVNTFSMSILMTLIRFCFPKYDDLWKQPDEIAMDDQRLANLILIQQYKNDKLDQYTTCRIPIKVFDEDIKTLENVFSELDLLSTTIDNMKHRKDFDIVEIIEIRNYQTVQSLLVDVGTNAMREYFLRDCNLNAEGVGEFLSNNKSKFNKINLLPEQKKIFEGDADIESFDISTMNKIISTCCNNPPVSFNRLCKYRNNLAHPARARMSEKEFDKVWLYLTDILKNVGVRIEEIDKYKQLRVQLFS
ncbi:uncharacterized protein LOC117121032 [Anneissia japonica]|uniref:uncharacterized protein LOC117121032 n=1 Tax=Anneissia japonica TaxID=1529436 RepID=UPI00142594FF|nr:uncharacterized protein LOC117121032 [Anneissia japonica]